MTEWASCLKGQGATMPIDLEKRPARQPDDAYVAAGLAEMLSARAGDPGLYDGAVANYLRRIHVGKILALWEAFRLVQDMPGHIVELGVFKGQSLLLFAKFMELMNPNDRSCSVIGFDNFSGFTGVHAKDGAIDTRVDKVVGGWSPADWYDDLKRHIHLFDFDRFVGHKPRIELVEGDICETVETFAKERAGTCIRLLNLDCDMYEPTLAGLKHLYDMVLPGGVILLDEFAFDQFPGEASAVREFFGPRLPRIRKFPFYSNPGGYIIKE
jgi:hypothetical protein